MVVLSLGVLSSASNVVTDDSGIDPTVSIDSSISLLVEQEIKVIINRDSGDIKIFRKLIVSENPENSNTEIKLEDAIILNEMNKDKSIGDEVLQPQPTFDYGRIAAQTAKQVININVREADTHRQ